MSISDNPSLVMTGPLWTFKRYPTTESEWSFEKKLEAVKDYGCDAFFCDAALDKDLVGLKKKFGLRFAGGIDVQNTEHMAERITVQQKLGDGPINCQLADHDTPIEEAIELTIALMEESEKRNANVHLEIHRDTCTETPEKAYAIIEGYEAQTGKKPKVNFDFSHPAVIKHLKPQDYTKRLIVRPDLLQECSTMHIRPFNGHHCQIPITDGKGELSKEFKEFRPFIKDLFDCWLTGPQPNRELWVVPELGSLNDGNGYSLSVFPDVTQDVKVLANEIKDIWADCLK